MSHTPIFFFFPLSRNDTITAKCHAFFFLCCFYFLENLFAFFVKKAYTFVWYGMVGGKVFFWGGGMKDDTTKTSYSFCKSFLAHEQTKRHPFFLSFIHQLSRAMLRTVQMNMFIHELLFLVSCFALPACSCHVVVPFFFFFF